MRIYGSHPAEWLPMLSDGDPRSADLGRLGEFVPNQS